VLRTELRMELSVEKTLVTHVDEGFDFLGHRLCRKPWRGKKVCMTFPSKKSLVAIKHKVKTLTTRSTTHHSLKTLLLRLNPVLRGWATYFRYDASKKTLAYVDHFPWWRVFRWLRKKHHERTWRYLRTRYCGGQWRISEAGTELFRPSRVRVEHYRFRGSRIVLPWMPADELGSVGRFARSQYDDPSSLAALEESLKVPGS